MVRSAKPSRRNPSRIPPWSEWPQVGTGTDKSRGIVIDGEKYFISPMYKQYTGRRSKKLPVEYDWIAMTIALHPRSLSSVGTARNIRPDGSLTDETVRYALPRDAISAVAARHAKIGG